MIHCIILSIRFLSVGETRKYAGVAPERSLYGRSRLCVPERTKGVCVFVCFCVISVFDLSIDWHYYLIAVGKK